MLGALFSEPIAVTVIKFRAPPAASVAGFNFLEAILRGLPRLAKARGFPFFDGAARKIQPIVDARRLRETELRILPPAGERAAIYAEFGRQLRRRDENFAVMHSDNCRL